MRYGFLNTWSQALAEPLAVGATTLVLNGGGGALAAASDSYRYKLTLVQRDALGNETHREIVDVTAADGDTLTVMREQEGTAALDPWATDTLIEARVTAGAIGTLTPAVVTFGPLDFSDTEASASWQAPAGHVLFVDGVEVVPLDDPAVVWAVNTSVAPTEGGQSMALSYDDAWVVHAGHTTDGTPTKVYATATWSVTQSLSEQGVKALRFSRDNSRLAACLSDGNRFIVWDTTDWSTVAGTPDLSVGGCDDVSWSNDGALCAITGWDGDNNDVVWIYETATWTVTQTLALSYQGFAVDWSPDGSMLALLTTGAPYVEIYNTSDWLEVPGPTVLAWPDAIAFSPDSAALAVGTDQVQVFDTTDWALIAEISIDDWANAIDWRAGRLAVVTGYAPYLHLIDAVEWLKMDAPSGIDSIQTDVVIAQDASFLSATSRSGQRLSVWEIDSDAPSLNLGTSDSAPSDILAAELLASFEQHKRMTAAVNQAQGVTSLYAEPAPAETGGADAMMVVRGYLLET